MLPFSQYNKTKSLIFGYLAESRKNYTCASFKQYILKGCSEKVKGTMTKWPIQKTHLAQYETRITTRRNAI